MATESFYEDLILDTPEACANMEKAIDMAEERDELIIIGAQKPIKDQDRIRALIRSMGYDVRTEWVHRIYYCPAGRPDEEHGSRTTGRFPGDIQVRIEP